MKKILIIGVILIVAVVGVGAYVLLSSIDSVVKAAVEEIGSDATGTKVSLNEVEISPISGFGALRGFRMTIPKALPRATPSSSTRSALPSTSGRS